MLSIAKKSKRRSNHSAKISQYQKRARSGLKGFTLKWFDENPFSENGNITNTEITHSNPTQKLICKEMWYSCQDWILNAEFTWQVVMRVIYETKSRGDKVDEYEFNFTCSLRGNKSDILNDAMQKELNDSLKSNNAFDADHKNHGIYKHCEFVAKVVGV